MNGMDFIIGAGVVGSNQMTNSALQMVDTYAKSTESVNRYVENIHRTAELNGVKRRVDEEKGRADDMQATATFYKNLLSKDFAEIALYNDNFAAAYYVQQQTMSDWMLSQKAFKVLSYDLGAAFNVPEEKLEDAYLTRVNKIAAGESYEKMPESMQMFVPNSVNLITNQVLKNRNQNQNGSGSPSPKM